MFSGTDAGGKVSYPAFVARLSLPLFLSVSLLFTGAHSRQPATLSIDALSVPDSNTSLQYHLCGPGTRELVSDTILQLSSGVHHLEEGPFCLLQTLENIAIQGQRTQPRTVVYCHSETQTRRGITFFNISNLHLSHIYIVNCGREVPSGLPGEVNNTFVYLAPLQKAVMIITYSTNITVESLRVERCFGFGLLFINPLRHTVIRGLLVSGTNSLGLSGCTQPQPLARNDMLCGGSGVAVIFSDMDSAEDLVKLSGNYKASLYMINCSFVNNTNWIPAMRLLDLLNSLIVAYDTERVLMTGGLSFALYMG